MSKPEKSQDEYLDIPVWQPTQRVCSETETCVREGWRSRLVAWFKRVFL